ncbi:MAG: hypothetical protein QXR19_13200 [Candidatus Jordarchaeaceae archaeon]
MAQVEKYLKYREAGQKLVGKIMNHALSREALTKSGKLLNMVRRGVFVFSNEEEMDVLADFALNEYKVNNKNAVRSYMEKIGGKDSVEKEILEALLSSYTSLFKVVSVSESESTIVLFDLLNHKENINLIDVNFSKTATPGLLIFTRLVPFKEFNMTSGIAFVFPSGAENFLLERYRRLSERAKSDINLPMKRFIFFYNWNKTKGIKAIYV